MPTPLSASARCGLVLSVLLIQAAWSDRAPAFAPEEKSNAHDRIAQFLSPGRPDASGQQPGKSIAFEMRDKPWIGDKGSVLEWLSDQTGMPVSISSAKPTGTLTFINPHADGPPKQYSLAEVIDILNGELLKQKLILVRRAHTFSIEPADEKLDPAVLPRVSPAELDQYGDTELVSVVFPLTSLVAEDFAGEVKGMLGPLGTVVALAQANKLVVQDTTANLGAIRCDRARQRRYREEPERRVFPILANTSGPGTLQDPARAPRRSQRITPRHAAAAARRHRRASWSTVRVPPGAPGQCSQGAHALP